MKGRKRTPTALRRLAGAKRSKLPKYEPRPAVILLEMPEGLSEPGKKEWERVAQEAYRLGLSTPLDRVIFTLYIHEWEIVRELQELCAEKGHHCFTKGGSPKAAPWAASLVQHVSLLKSILLELGFTPSSRARVSVVDPAKELRAELVAFDGGKQ